MTGRRRRSTYLLLILGGVSILLGGCSSAQPVNVHGGVFNQSCPQAHAIYTVPAGKLLIIEDASAHAVNSAAASIPGNPDIVDNEGQG